TEMFFDAVMREDRSILDFLVANFSYVNRRLAEHYGLENRPGGDEFQRVEFTDGRRGGVLTQASILTLTSNPTRTSPVKRGKWIMENILGTPPPEPPADVPLLEATSESNPNLSLREQMELHRRDPGCASCHRVMDTLGFGFENFDAVGRWRDKDNGAAIDPSGVLPSGESFRGPAELVRTLSQSKDDFARLLTDKMLTYALGRGLEPYDKCAVDEIVKQIADDEYRFSTLVTGIVLSEPFRMRRGEEAKP
ncbi:MAG: DUF1588 domain-containing protein, partial [Planctomycetales bacterium]|nr:DUF1588 domain-containing protein [Planctomycetales bacterium]